MSSSRYMQYQEDIRAAHLARGERISNRTVQRLARARMQAEDGFTERIHDREPSQTLRRRPRACEVDPTGQQAVKNVMKQNSGPGAHSAKNNTEAA